LLLSEQSESPGGQSTSQKQKSEYDVLPPVAVQHKNRIPDLLAGNIFVSDPNPVQALMAEENASTKQTV